jgi:Rod binding domain-containing protein
MSSVAPIAATGLSVVDEARAPASVRNGSAAVKQDYATAQGFEEMLLQQLSQSLAQSSGLSGEGGGGGGEGAGEEGSSEGGEAGGGMLSSLLPQTLTESVMREGGLGLATQLMGTLDPSTSTTARAAIAPTGGAAA